MKTFQRIGAALLASGWDAVFPKKWAVLFAPDAFQNIPLGNYRYGKLRISADIVLWDGASIKNWRASASADKLYLDKYVTCASAS